MGIQIRIIKSGSFKRFLYIMTAVLLIAALSSMTFITASSADRGAPRSPCCEGGSCCILSDCECPNCEDRDEPGTACSRCNGDLCANCGNCYECGTSPCPLCRDYCFVCGSFDLCETCNGCLDCGHNRDANCPDCGEELLPVNDFGNDAFPDFIIEDGPVPLFSVGGLDFFMFAPPGMSAWAILSLVLTISGIIFSIVITILAIRQKESEHKEFDERTSELYSVNTLENLQLLGALENEEQFNKQRRLWALVMVYLLSFCAVLFLLLLQDFRGVIVLFDRWVIVHSIIFAGILVCGKLVFKRYEAGNEPAYAFSLQ